MSFDLLAGKARGRAASRAASEPRPESGSGTSPEAIVAQSARRESTSALGYSVARFEQMRGAAIRRLDKKTVHQLRVSIRRLQAALRLMGLHEERRSLRPLMQLAGEVRNRDVAMELAEPAPMRQELWQQRRHHAAALKEAVRAFALAPLVEQPLAPPAGLVKAFFRAGRRAAGKPTAGRLHALRLAGKRLRYAIEFLLPVLDASVIIRLRDLKHLQQELGQANDCATARTLTSDAEFHAVLARKEQGHRGRFAEYWRENFEVLGAWESWRLFWRGVVRQAAAVRRAVR